MTFTIIGKTMGNPRKRKHIKSVKNYKNCLKELTKSTQLAFTHYDLQQRIIWH